MTSAQHNHYNTIKLSSYIVSTLASTVAPTLGPSSIDQVIVNHTNDILITNSGYSIIKAVNIEGPIGKYVLNCIKKIDNSYGDGCTTYTIILDGLLKNSIYYSSYLSKHNSATYNDNLKSVNLNKLSIAVRDIQILWYPKIIFPMIKEWSIECNKTDMEQIMYKIIDSSIGGSFGRETSEFLANILIEWIKASLPGVINNSNKKEKKAKNNKSNDNDNNNDASKMMLQNTIAAIHGLLNFFPVLIVPKAMLQDTKVIKNGYILKKSFARINAHNYDRIMTTLQSSANYKRFIVIIGLLTIDFKKTKNLYGGSSNVKIKGIISDKNPGKEWEKYPAERAFQYTKILKKHGVNLIICTEEINDIWKNAFTQFGILAIQYVEPEDAKFICYKAKMQPIYNLTMETCLNLKINGINNNIDESNIVEIGQIEEFRQVALGNEYHIVLENFITINETTFKKQAGLTTAQLLLRAPSKGIADQYRNCFKRLLSVLKSWFKNEHDNYITYPKYFIGPNIYEHRLRCWFHYIVLWLRLHNNNDETDNNNNNMKLEEENYKVNFWMTTNFNNDVYINVLKQSRSQSHELIHAFKTLLGGFNNYFYVLKNHQSPLSNSNFNPEFIFDTTQDDIETKLLYDIKYVIDSFNGKINTLEQLLNTWYQLLKIENILPAKSIDNDSNVIVTGGRSNNNNNNWVKKSDDNDSSSSDEGEEEL